MITIQKIMSEVLRIPPERIQDSMHMRDVEEWDSLKHMELILTIERACGIELSGDEIAEMTSLSAIKAILAKHGVAA